MTRSLAQRRAEHALACIKALSAENRYGNYLAFVKSLPATIIISGLGQAMAMEAAGAAKGNNDVGAGHSKLYANLQSWLCNENGKGWQSSPYSGSTSLIEAIVGGTEAEYIRSQAEAMEYLEWLKKFAVAFLKESEDQSRSTAVDAQ